MYTVKNTIRKIVRTRQWEFRRYDVDLSLDTYLWMHIEHYDINCVLDVGGRFGDYGFLLRENGYKGEIISFEPVEANFRQLQQRCSADPAWHAYHLALGSESGSAEINVSRSTNYSSFLAPSAYGFEHDAGICVDRTEVVPVKRLDEIVDEVTRHIAEPRIYLKMDTQGFDLSVLRGAKGCLDKVLALQSELSMKALYEQMPDWTTALAEFNAAGYEVSAFFTVCRDSKMRLSEMDCVMVRSE
ncbi:MAG: methyltransferase FkbM family [Chthonomonadaceae bacterium]|nr:methyltransferase FkbM family [Chthonomonadaceae bacterium]